MLVEGEVRHQPFEADIFFFHLPQSAELAHLQMRILLFPGVEGGVTTPELSAGGANGRAGFGLSDGIDDLLLRAF